ncbi:unnamed protein product [Cuscuta europaea]|uniref:Glucosidase II beta subunit N-terminal domain-containing protein n=1 Tax=Cuscuta europaea TaxID=41803 RepID=A0A9P0Z7L8_CUSEU|nr:unnamed protein product [Cuscuta europaea]
MFFFPFCYFFLFPFQHKEIRLTVPENSHLTRMETGDALQRTLLLHLCVASLSFHLCRSSTLQLPIGIHPLDEKYYTSSELINCKDGSKKFTRDRLNDDFCDCLDGTDEPGTAACPHGKFYCRNMGNTPKFLFSSQVNDRICDCCDGSDENDGAIGCPNTCVMGGDFAYETRSHVSRDDLVRKVGTEDPVQKVKGLKILVVLQVLIILIVVGIPLLCRRSRSRRRHSH